MGARHGGREAALQMLFQQEASNAEPESVIALFFRHFEADAEGRDYAQEAFLGAVATRAELDALLTKAADNWRLERMSRVDRNVLRLATWELSKRSDVPRSVILNEAVVLGKTYGGESSGAFVNGVLTRVADNLGRRDETP